MMGQSTLEQAKTTIHEPDFIGRSVSREGGRDRWRKAFCQNYNIAIRCSCCVQPVL